MSAEKTDVVVNAAAGYVRKNECLKMIKILNHNVRNYEKEQKSFISNKKGEKDYMPIYEMYITFDCYLKTEKYNLAQKINQTAQMIKHFKQESKIIKPSQQVLDTLRALMEQIDASISGSKEEFLLQSNELDNEEKILAKEIDVYDKKIQNWSSNSDGGVAKASSANRANSSISDKLTDSNLLREVVDFDKFLIQNGGHTGEWEEIDHNLFLKIRNRTKVANLSTSFIDELVEMIATKSREQIIQHEDWYKKYLNLNELKKRAIKVWKENKKATVSEVVNLVDAELKLNQEIEKELKHRFEKQKEMEKMERQKRLNEWKLDRGIERAKEQERRRIEEAKRLEREEKERQQKEEKRQRVMEYKRQKEELNSYIEIEQILIKEAEIEQRRKQTQVEINYFQSRDQEKIQDKKHKKQEKQESLEEKQRRLERARFKVEVERDPNRLYQMTSTWKSRVNTPRSESYGPVTVNRIPHLAVPTWRQGI